jgi:hypothetical protein
VRVFTHHLIISANEQTEDEEQEEDEVQQFFLPYFLYLSSPDFFLS